MLREITPIVLTFNEQDNLARTLEALRWAREVIVLDSGSTDSTLDIARGFANVRVCTRPFDHHAEQWNHALRNCGVATEWVMALDADYVVGEALVREIEALAPADDVTGYEIGFRYCIEGAPLRRSLYPPLVVLFRSAAARYERHGHRMVLRLDGAVRKVEATIDHDDRKSFGRWMQSQRRYATLEAERLRSTPLLALRKRDLVRRAVVLAPWLVPVWCVVVLGLWRNRRAGWQYVRERAVAEWLIARALVRGPQ